MGHLVETYQITGGTDRFEGAKGTLTSNVTLKVVLFSSAGAPKLLTMTGNIEGKISGPRKAFD